MSIYSDEHPNWYGDNNNVTCYVARNTHTLYIYDPDNPDRQNKYLILEYTKTTDTPNSTINPVTWKATAGDTSYDDTALTARVKALEDKLASIPTYTNIKEV